MKQLAVISLSVTLLCPNLFSEPSAKEQFETQDKELNRVYGELKKELEAYQFAIVQKEQRDWVEYRDYISEAQRGYEGTSDEEAQLEMAAGLTESRVQWLQAWKTAGEHEGLEGEYRDSYGGFLQIVKEGEQHYFALHVVRGPSFHLGIIGGKLRVNGSTGWFETRDEHDGKEAWLTFVPKEDGSGRIRIVSENARHFHGARAYFDGSYLRLGEVSAEDRKRVISGELE
ncbi:lysozyme inhibitor LprI family protein [Roseibacillus persicicus]|uniref:lysozyme inhibitor LprI family protein n=1 Tax=Roseibacillus persicicus TaxID=454148 RepID=UPI00398B6A5F